jgi:uncharacterized protein (TIGR02284 family)
MSNSIDKLAALHTAAIDARNGYREAEHEAQGKGLTPLFAELEALHQKHADELAQLLMARGQKADQNGSFMSVVHKTIMDVRALFGGLDESVIPGLIDGEQRNVAKYDQALKEPEVAEVQDVLGRQKGELSAQINRMLAAQPKT